MLSAVEIQAKPSVSRLGGATASTSEKPAIRVGEMASPAANRTAASTTTGPTIGNGINILHNYPEVVDILQSKQIRMFTFADYIGGQCECDDVSMGFFTDFQGQPPIPMQTGGAAFNIGEVLAGITSLADAITQSVEDSYCEEYPPPE